ncbi:MAG: glycosyltransferase family 39 protein [Syntrophomonas sp.]
MQPKQKPRFDLFLLGIALLAAFLNTYNIWNNLTGNTYYTAAVTSMLQSWHNFFFNSFDPGGYITIDKPPVTFWVQTLFAYIFGVHGWSVILPQALAGVGSVLLLYKLVKPSFGLTAARFASLIIACTPVAAAVSRTNNIDSLLVFTLLLAAWMLFKAMRNQKLSWVLGAFAMIGVGFNEKMLQAYMVVPAFYLFYLLAFKCAWKKKLAILAAATVVLVSVSLSWAVIVDSIPQDSRPYIGGSKTNSVLELALGYNGISRLTGNQGGGMGKNDGAMPNQTQVQMDDGNGTIPEGFTPGSSGQNGYRPQGAPPSGSAPNGATPNGAPPQGFNHNDDGGPGQRPDGYFKGTQGRGSNGMFNTGQAGPLRLFQSELSGQASWLLPLVGFACVALLAGIRRRKPLTDKEKETLFWLAWLIPAAAFFSVAGFFHQYYLIMLAPPIAALAGAGWVELWNLYRSREGWKTWLLPAALFATTAFELFILQPYQSQIGIGWSIGIGSAGTVITVLLIMASKKEKLTSWAMIAGMLVLLAGPLYWAATPLIYGDNNVMPAAGPSQNQMGQRQGMVSNMKSESSDSSDKLISYLTKNNTGEKYLFATTDANTAGPYIIKTGKAVMAMGGFSGTDQVLTVSKIEKMVKNKEVKYFLISSGIGGGRGGSSEVLNWVRTHSTEVPQSEWQSTASQGGQLGRGESNTLYLIDQSKL